jgi:hypothetical protein
MNLEKDGSIKGESVYVKLKARLVRGTNFTKPKGFHMENVHACMLLEQIKEN